MRAPTYPGIAWRVSTMIARPRAIEAPSGPLGNALGSYGCGLADRAPQPAIVAAKSNAMPLAFKIFIEERYVRRQKGIPMASHETDPNRSTSPQLRRGAFVGYVAAAGAAVGTLPAVAASLALVPDDDPHIVVEHVNLTTANGSIPAYAASPKHASADTPSVVVVMHIWGVDASIREVVRRLAAAGYAAIAPDLYARFGAPSGDGNNDFTTFRPFAKQLERPKFVGDVSAAASWLSTRFAGTKTAVLGFCMGGRMAMQAAIDTGTRFAAVFPFYGSFDDVDPAAIAMPWCGSYGARDTSIPPADVEAFVAKLHVPKDVKIYDDAGHAFFDDHRASYVPTAAANAWQRVLAFLKQYVGPPQS
jgi:carboxymethylenebutenolidase